MSDLYHWIETETFDSRIKPPKPRTVEVQWEYEDQLPDGLTDEQYAAMWPMSRVDIVRLFPFVIVGGTRTFLTWVGGEHEVK